jgi:hypothetical protein
MLEDSERDEKRIDGAEIIIMIVVYTGVPKVMGGNYFVCISDKIKENAKLMVQLYLPTYRECSEWDHICSCFPCKAVHCSNRSYAAWHALLTMSCGISLMLHSILSRSSAMVAGLVRYTCSFR